MKRMRIPLLCTLAVAVIGIILGSFLDLSISKAIASSSNKFALTISAIVPTIGFAGVAAMGGGFVALALHGKYHIVLKVLFFVLAGCCLAVSLIYPHGEYFGINGFYNEKLDWLGYVIVLLPECGAMVGGYFLYKDCQNKNLWIIFCIVIVTLLIALLAVIPTIKDNMHRPRYRWLADEAHNLNLFHNWWEPFPEYKNYLEFTHKDNFKSYPSGHTAEASILFVCITFLPLANKKYEKIQLPLFFAACGIVLLVAIARILAAAHYLSDVSWGATIVLSLLIIANEVVMRIKALQIQE